MNEIQIKKYLFQAIQASLLAATKIMAVYACSDFAIEEKPDHSPLTEADQQAHRVIVSILQKTSIPILSEEGKKIPYEERKDWDWLWIVDPLDGTKEFIKRNGEFTVNIALIHNRFPVFGIIYAPVLQQLYLGGKHFGSYSCQLAPDELPVNLDVLLENCVKLPLQVPRSSYTIMASRSHATPELQQFVEKKRNERKEITLISSGSSIKICRVAENIADIYPRLGPTMEWDTAAGQGIAEGANREVTIWETGKRLSYNRENLLNPWFVVK